MWFTDWIGETDVWTWSWMPNSPNSPNMRAMPRVSFRVGTSMRSRRTHAWIETNSHWVEWGGRACTLPPMDVIKTPNVRMSNCRDFLHQLPLSIQAQKYGHRTRRVVQVCRVQEWAVWPQSDDMRNRLMQIVYALDSSQGLKTWICIETISSKIENENHNQFLHRWVSVDDIMADDMRTRYNMSM